MPSPSVGHHHPVGHPRFSSAHHLPDSVPGGPQPPLRDENLNSGSRDRSPGRWHYTRRGLGPRIDPRSGGTVASIFALVATIYRTATHCEEASRLSLARRRERTTSRGTRRHSPGYCVPDCERVRVNGDAALRVLQRPPTWERGGPPAFAPAKVSMPNPARDPESAESRHPRCAERGLLFGNTALDHSRENAIRARGRAYSGVMSVRVRSYFRSSQGIQVPQHIRSRPQSGVGGGRANVTIKRARRTRGACPLGARWHVPSRRHCAPHTGPRSVRGGLADLS